MKRWAFFFFTALSVSAMAEHNASVEADSNTTKKVQLQKHVEEELKREANFAKTQAFQMGDDYNLSEHQVDPNDLDSVPVIEPEYDFNMDDVYD